MTTSKPLFAHAAFLFAQMGFYVEERFTALLAPLGIGPRQHGLLSVLIGRDGQTQQQLCEALDIHRNVMVGMVDELEKRGFAERRRHPTDRRAHAVHLLPAGREMHIKSEEVLNKFEADMLSGLPTADGAALVALLQQVSQHVGLRPEIHPALDQPPGSRC